MRFVTIKGTEDDADRAGAVVDGRVVALAGGSAFAALAAHRRGAHDLDAATDVGSVDEVLLAAPVPRPGKIVCVGLNYVDHAAETMMELPEVPLLFAKFPSAVVGPGAAIELPPMTAQLDWEAELAVVIGQTARDLAAPAALGAIGGYMNLNDISARDVQLGEGGQWTRGKSFDTFAPTGPLLVSADEVDDPQELSVRCEVNGAVMQSSSTADMIFPVAELIAFISRSMTLHPGDIIATGTPPGVGMGRTPPVYLQDGDEVAMEVTGLGRLTNPVRAAG